MKPTLALSDSGQQEGSAQLIRVAVVDVTGTVKTEQRPVHYQNAREGSSSLDYASFFATCYNPDNRPRKYPDEKCC